MEIDRNTVEQPKIELTDHASQQLNLILANDYTLEGKEVRLSITGKECDGFVYSIGFDNKHTDDFCVTNTQSLRDFILDPMCAYYLNSSYIDFVQDHENDEEGFVILNKNQDTYKKKFWLKDPAKLPTLTQDDNNDGL